MADDEGVDEMDEINEEDIVDVIELNEDEEIAENDHGDEDHFELEEEEMNEENGTTELVDDSILTFNKHTGEIFAVDVGYQNVVATGGEDDRAYVWDIKSGQVLFECFDHADSVTSVKFNAKKTLLATADMSGIIQIWKMDDFKKLHQFQIGDLEWLCWHHSADILFCGDVDGSVWMWLVPNGNCKVYSGHGPSCSAGVLFPDGKRLCAGYGDGVVKIWDLKEANFVSVNGASCHTESVTCLDCYTDNNIAASGSEDGTVNLFHATTGKIIDTIVCAKKAEGSLDGDDSISVETVAFCTVSPFLAVGTIKGDLTLWDVNASQIRQQLKHSDGIVKAFWMQHLVFTSCLDGVLRLWDSRSGEMVREWKGHRKEILDFTLTEDAQNVISVSADEICKVFSLNNVVDR